MRRYFCIAYAVLLILFAAGCSLGAENVTGAETESPVVETPSPSPEPELGGYSLGELETSMLEYCDAASYIEGAAGEYIRRMGEDPAAMEEHLESLPLGTRAYIFRAIAAEKSEALDAFVSEGDGEAVSLLAEYMAYYGSTERGEPPASGVLCEAFIPKNVPFLDFMTDYVSDSLLIFHASEGVFVYDRASGEIVFSADLLTALGDSVVQGSDCACVRVTSDGGSILLFWSENGEPPENCYLIRGGDWSYEYGGYEALASGLTGDLFECDAEIHGSVLCGADGNGRSLEELVYVLGDEAVPLF